VSMSVAELKNHGEVLRNRKEGDAMPGGVYGRQDIFESDIDIFFNKHWIVVGVTAGVPKPGDVSTVDIGAASVTIVRDDDQQIRAFRNAHLGNGFDKTRHSLIPVHVKVVGAHILVCLAEDPPGDIAHLEETMMPRFAPYDLKHTKIAYETEIIENGNWKLVIENNRECYHCSAGHPELNVSFLPEDFGFSKEEMSEESLAALDSYFARNASTHESWEKDGHIHAAIEYLEEDATTQFRTQRLVIAGAGESQTMDTQVACTKLFGELTRRDLGDTHFWTHNSWTHVMSDHAVVSYLIPLSPDRTIVRTKWLVHADAVEGVDYDLERMTEVWTATNAQDAGLVAVNHRGTQDPGFIPGPYSPFTETYVYQFTRWYAARLKAHGI
jgi:glycine betaine catabolism A